MGENLTIYTIYTSEDKASMLSVVDHLKPLEKQHKLTIFHEDPIQKGQPWKPKTESEFKEADIFLLFVSNAFMYSEFVKQLEFKTVIDRYKEGSSKVIPVLIDKSPWDINFEADNYTFSFKELEVLPTDRKPIKNWESPEKAISEVSTSIKGVIASIKGYPIEEIHEEVEEPEEVKEILLKESKGEEQIAISFDEKQSEDKNAIAEAQRKAEEQNRLLKEAEAKNNLEQQRKRQEEEASKRIAKEQRRKEAIETKRLAEEKRIKEEAESKRREAESKRFQEEVAAKRSAEKEQQKKASFTAKQKSKESQKENTTSSKKRMLWIVGALIAIVGLWALSKSNTDSDKQSPAAPEIAPIAVEDSSASDKTEIEPVEIEEAVSELSVGDSYDGGIVFEIDSDGKTGIIVHLDDAGPMTWNKAMSIHEQLGEGWRVPTFNELLRMQKTIGQGNTNSGEFADGLYWSATPFDENQAKLVRFRDGNTSYHYNSRGNHRKFLVRAIRDFNR
ncbi:MAG: TIR domain-containing protein [Maribacter sp.]